MYVNKALSPVASADQVQVVIELFPAPGSPTLETLNIWHGNG